MWGEQRRIREQMALHKDLLQKLDDVLLTTIMIEDDMDLSEFPKRRDVMLFLYCPHSLGVWSPLHQTRLLAFGLVAADVFADVADERLADAGFSQISTEVRPRKATITATFGASRVNIVYRRVSSLEPILEGRLKRGNSPLPEQLSESYWQVTMPEQVHRTIGGWIEDAEVSQRWSDMRTSSQDIDSKHYDQLLVLEFDSSQSQAIDADTAHELVEDLVSYDLDTKWKSRPWPKQVHYKVDNAYIVPAYVLAAARTGYATTSTAELLAKWRTTLEKLAGAASDSEAELLSNARIELIGQADTWRYRELQPDKIAAESEFTKQPPQPTRRNHKDKIRLRPADDVYNRIKWDPKLHVSEYLIGYLDRFEGVMEIPFEEWSELLEEENFVPMHRVRYFKRIRDGAIVWDREKRVDRVFGQ